MRGVRVSKGKPVGKVGDDKLREVSLLGKKRCIASIVSSSFKLTV